MRFSFAFPAVSATLMILSVVQAIELNVSDAGSIKSAAASIAFDMMSYYTGNQTNNAANVGLLPSPYYWWEAGAMWGAMIDYWHYTEDPTYNTVVAQAILSQISPTSDFMMANQQFDLGNDDQLFWSLTAMTAAEYNFPSPASSPSWISIATNVFNDVSARWNTTQCNGGLKWQFYPSNVGFDYKQSIANGAYFQLGARLARYTGNTTYLTWAEKTWDWMSGVGLISPNNNVYDGSGDLNNCTQINQLQWTYNNAVFLYGSAILANVTAADSASPWENRTIGLMYTAYDTFFSPFANATNVMYEAECEKVNSCNNDQFSFKAYLSRYMYATARMMPALGPDILSLMVPTAQAAAQSCSGGAQSRTCGTRWWYSGWDGGVGVGQQMSALEAVHGLLLYTVRSLPPGPADATAGSSRRKRHVRNALV